MPNNRNSIRDGGLCWSAIFEFLLIFLAFAASVFLAVGQHVKGNQQCGLFIRITLEHGEIWKQKDREDGDTRDKRP